jgi:hypothetical protein
VRHFTCIRRCECEVPSVAAVANNARSNLVRGDGRFGRLPLDNPLTEFVDDRVLYCRRSPAADTADTLRQGEGKKL